MTLAGIDVSSAQGQIDWTQVAAAGVQWAAIKATEGVSYTNPFYAPDLAGARAAGLRVIHYHYGLPAWNAAADEAAYFLSVVQAVVRSGDILSLDLEENQEGRTLPADVGPWALAWFAAAEAPWSGYLGIQYTNLDLIQNHGLAAVGATNRGLWLASPGNPNPPTPPPWSVIAIVQTSWTGSVPGIGGAVDVDAFEGDASAFDRYGIPQPAKPAFDTTARLQLCGYAAGGSSRADLVAWLSGFGDG
jgi:GH25 family lysozyme M1 (1,4-beta-N-acetylmuramidase)